MERLTTAPEGRVGHCCLSEKYLVGDRPKEPCTERVQTRLLKIALVGFQGLRLPWCPRGVMAFKRPLKNKGIQEERVTTRRLDDLGQSTTLQSNKSHSQLVAMSEKQAWEFFALQELNFQFFELNFQFLEGNFKMSEPCAITTTSPDMRDPENGAYR